MSWQLAGLVLLLGLLSVLADIFSSAMAVTTETNTLKHCSCMQCVLAKRGWGWPPAFSVALPSFQQQLGKPPTHVYKRWWRVYIYISLHSTHHSIMRIWVGSWPDWCYCLACCLYLQTSLFQQWQLQLKQTHSNIAHVCNVSSQREGRADRRPF